MQRIKTIGGKTTKVLAATIALCLSQAVLAQSTTGTIFGNVPAGQGDTVLIKGDSGYSREVPIDNQGHYSSAQLRVGDYTVTLEHNGKAVDRRDHVIVTVGSGIDVSFTEAAVASSATTAAKNLSGVSVSANSTPPIDITTVDSRTVITAQELARLPLARSAEAIAQLAPGVVNNSGGFTSATGQSLVSFGGSSAGENAYYINGFNTTDPLKGAGGITLPYGAIDQEEIYTGGYSAQYGRSDGGVINMVGKRGTNEWHFGAQLLWEPSFARANQQDVYYSNGAGIYDPKSQNRSWVSTIDAYVGGPLIKDKLFIFLAAEAQKSEATSLNSVQSSSPDVHYTYKMPKWYAKVDWNITDSNVLELTGASNKESTSGSIYNYDYTTNTRTSLKGLADDTKVGGDLWSAKFTSYITDDLTFTALYGKMKTVNYDSPAGYNSNLTYLTDTNYENPAYTGGTPITNSQTVSSLYSSSRSNKTDNLRLDLTYKIGGHTISLGIDNQNATAIDQGSETSGPGYYWDYDYTSAPTVALSTGLGVGAPANYPNGASGYYVIKDVSSSLSTVRSAQRAQYIEDKWQISDRWLVSIGIRNDQYTDYNSESVAYVKQTKPQWAPRLGFAWDVNGDGSFKVYGNAGRYYLGLPLQPSVDAASGNVGTSQYYTYSGIAADGTPTGLTAISNPVSANNNFGNAPDPKTVTAKNLRAEDQDEYILGFDKTFDNSAWVYGSKLTFRKLRNAVDDFCDVGKVEAEALAAGFTDSSSNSCYLINPGRANVFTVVDATGAYRNVTVTNDEFGFPALKRKYYALDSYLEHPFDGTWYAKLEYTFSRSYGNTEGQERSDLQQFGASESEDWDNSYVMENTNGPQNNDHTHQIKLYGYYKIAPEWMVSATVQAISGVPRNCLGYYGADHSDPASYGSAYHYCNGLPSPPGSHGRMPWMYQLDLGVSYSPNFAQQKLAFTLNVFNVFNGHAALSTYDRYEQSPYSINPRYNTVLTQQTPRYVRIGATYDF